MLHLGAVSRRMVGPGQTEASNQRLGDMEGNKIHDHRLFLLVGMYYKDNSFDRHVWVDRERPQLRARRIPNHYGRGISEPRCSESFF